MSPVIREDCPCPKTSCKRHTLCNECKAFRATKGKLPYCQRPKRSLREKMRKLLGWGT